MTRAHSFAMIAGASALAIGLTAAPFARAATIFDVNFNTDTISQRPGTATASAAPPANTKPTKIQAAGDVTVQDGTTAPAFSEFGSGNFVVIDVTTRSNGLNFEPASANQVTSGVIRFTADFQIDTSVTGSTGNFELPFSMTNSAPNGNTSIGILQISVSDGKLYVVHQDGTGKQTEAVGSLDPSKKHTVEGILTLNGNQSSLAYKVDGSTLQTGGGVDSFKVDPGDDNPFKLLIIHSVSNMTGRVALDNVTMDISPVPEPASGSLLLLGGLGVLSRRRRRI